MFSTRMNIEDFDPALWAAMRAETRRQEDHIELIASENYASPRVLQAQGSALTNKYAEGYPGKRYYGGCEHVDEVERLAIERACALFGAWANVQPHSGSQANAAVYQALLTPGDTVAGMSLAHGGHLTHGAKVNFSGKLYQAVQYGVNTEGLIDYDALFRLAQEHRPRMLVAGFSAYSRHLDFPGCARSPTASAPGCSSTSRTAWSRPGCIPIRCLTRTSSPPPRTRRSGVRAAVSSWAAPIRISKRRSPRWCSPASRAAR